MVKKLSAILLGIALVGSSVFSGAALTDYKAQSAGKISTNGTVILYSYNVPADTKSFIKYENVTKGTSETYNFADFYNHPQPITLSTTDEYKPMLGVKLNGTGGSGGGASFTYGKTAGKYSKLTLKLSEFNSYFNSDGSHTQGGHTYTFRQEEKMANGDQYTSALVFESAGAVTMAVPNKKGEVTIYVSAEIGVPTFFSTTFQYIIVSHGGYTIGGGGGVNHGTLCGVAKGDVNASGYVHVDDATMIQSRCADLIGELNAAEKYCADVNKDGEVDINDATYIQMYAAGLYR